MWRRKRSSSMARLKSAMAPAKSESRAGSKPAVQRIGIDVMGLEKMVERGDRVGTAAEREQG